MDVWAPKYETVGAEPFVNNMLAVYRAHEREAFRYVSRPAWGEGITLEPFAVFNNSVRRNQRWAALTVAPRVEETPPGESGQYVDAACELIVSVEIIHPLTAEGNEIGSKLLRYARAVRMMTYAATPEEMTAGLDTSKYGALNIEVSPTRYDSLLNREGTALMKLATMIVGIKLLEA